MNRAATIGLAFALLTGCSYNPTQLVVVVESDLEVPTTMSEVRARVSRLDGSQMSSHTFVLAGPNQVTSADRMRLPLSFGVSPIQGQRDDDVIIELEAFGPAGAMFTHRVQTGFIQGRTLRVPCFLADACRMTTCGAGETCGQNGCMSDTLDEAQLDQVRAGDELP